MNIMQIMYFTYEGYIYIVHISIRQFDCSRSRSGSICSNSLVFSSSSVPPPGAGDLSVVSHLDILDRLPESRVDSSTESSPTASIVQGLSGVNTK